jgi:Tol biopolymer transport system component
MPSRNLKAGEPQRLTHDGKLKFAPVFLPGGKQIVFCVHNVPNRVSLMRLDLGDGEQRLLFPSMAAHLFDADVSRDGRYHCFVISAISPQLVLIIKDLHRDKSQSAAVDQYEQDGITTLKLTLDRAKVFKPKGARSTVRTPRIMPDGSRVVFTHSGPGGKQIASVDMQGGDLKKLTQSAGINCWPAISPDGKKIAFSSSREGHFQIYVMNADGSNVHRLTHSKARDVRPAWSPDGTQIAFTSARDGNYEIYLMQSDASNVRRVTNHPERDDYPTWHPDGKQLLTISQRNGRSDLYLFDLTGGNL